MKESVGKRCRFTPWNKKSLPESRNGEVDAVAYAGMYLIEGALCKFYCAALQYAGTGEFIPAWKLARYAAHVRVTLAARSIGYRCVRLLLPGLRMEIDRSIMLTASAGATDE